MKKSIFVVLLLLIIVLIVGLFISITSKCNQCAETKALQTALDEAELQISALKSQISNAPPENPLEIKTERVVVDVAQTEPEPLMVSTVDVSGVDSNSPPPMTDSTLNAIQRFDYAMDREFNRLDQREETSGDSTEAATINTIKEKLGELDELYIRADSATNTEERIAIRKDMQQTMGSIIGLARRDRNERLSKLATDIGYTDPQAVEQFVREIDRVYRETHMDWTKLFNRTPPAMGPAGDRSISPGMQTDSMPPDARTPSAQ